MCCLRAQSVGTNAPSEVTPKWHCSSHTTSWKAGKKVSAKRRRSITLHNMGSESGLVTERGIMQPMTLLPIANWWPTTQLLIILTSMFQPGGLFVNCLQDLWVKNILLVSTINSCVAAQQFDIGISQHNYGPLQHQWSLVYTRVPQMSNGNVTLNGANVHKYIYTCVPCIPWLVVMYIEAHYSIHDIHMYP